MAALPLLAAAPRTQLRGTTPQYARVANHLLSEIGAGRHPPGSLLPTEEQLGAHFGVSRITVRSALKELELRGLVSRRPGIGTRVEAVQSRESFVHSSNSLDELIQFTRSMIFRQLSVADVKADARLHDELELPLGQLFLRVRGLRTARGQPPVCLSEHFVPAIYRASALRFDGRRGSLADFLAEDQADEVAQITQTIEAVNLTAADARLLGCKPRDAAMLSHRLYFGAAGRLLLAARSLFPKGRYMFRSRLRRDDRVRAR